MPNNLAKYYNLTYSRNTSNTNSQANSVDFTAWSWAGWIAPVSYGTPYIVHNHFIRPPRKGYSHDERIIPLIRWYKYNDTGKINDPVNGCGSGVKAAVSEDGKMPQPWVNYQKTPFREALRIALPRSPHFLKFRASTAQFRFQSSAAHPNGKYFLELSTKNAPMGRDALYHKASRLTKAMEDLDHHYRPHGSSLSTSDDESFCSLGTEYIHQDHTSNVCFILTPDRGISEFILITNASIVAQQRVSTLNPLVLLIVISEAQYFGDSEFWTNSGRREL